MFWRALTLGPPSRFDSWFGYILWAFAYFEIYRESPSEKRTLRAKAEYAFNIREPSHLPLASAPSDFR